MIVYKKWTQSHRMDRNGYVWHGWFLFGIVPLYLRRDGLRLK